MSAVDERVAFVRRCLDDDERVAREALHADAVQPGVWITEHHNSETHSEPNRCHIAEDRSGHYWSVAHEVFIPNAEHIARWDPARVLDEVEAKRRILDDLDGEYLESPSIVDGLSVRVLLSLAQPFAGREGWREEWSATP